MARQKFNPQDKLGFDIEVEECPMSFRDHFIVPPFSVLDARAADWQNRKKAWLSLGIRSELGRGENALKFSKTATTGFNDFLKSQMSHEEKVRATLYKSQDRLNEIMSQRRGAVSKTKTTPDSSIRGVPDFGGKAGFNKMSGTSIFDPVLCELAYRWFCPPGGTVLDPFAGGSVRGIVASMLDYQYTGVELRKEQVDANVDQWGEMAEKPFAEGKPTPNWICGDSMKIRSLAKGQYDSIFSCPPYGDLEVYSKDPSDISNMGYAGFLEAYRAIIKRSCSMLKDNRLACFVVGDFRDKKTGALRNFINDTIEAFEDAGLIYYNDAILVTMVGSLPIRAGAHFRNYRKLGRTHQMVLVFYKGSDCSNLKGLFEEAAAEQEGEDGSDEQ